MIDNAKKMCLDKVYFLSLNICYEENTPKEWLDIFENWTYGLNMTAGLYTKLPINWYAVWKLPWQWL